MNRAHQISATATVQKKPAEDLEAQMTEHKIVEWKHYKRPAKYWQTVFNIYEA